MKVGDLVCNLGESKPRRYGLVVEIITTKPKTLPLVCRMLYPDAAIEKEWADELELVNEKSQQQRSIEEHP